MPWLRSHAVATSSDAGMLVLNSPTTPMRIVMRLHGMDARNEKIAGDLSDPPVSS